MLKLCSKKEQKVNEITIKHGCKLFVDLTRRAKFHQNITLKNFVQLDGKGEWGEGDGWQRYPNKEVFSDVCQDLCSGTNIDLHIHSTRKCHHNSL